MVISRRILELSVIAVNSADHVTIASEFCVLVAAHNPMAHLVFNEFRVFDNFGNRAAF